MSVSVSVCMITYGHSSYLEEAIEGILSQVTKFEYELIIANDCSPDNSDDIVNGFIKVHPKGNCIRYIKHQENVGMNKNFAFALQQCKGKYIALCEGDDYWIDDYKLQKQFNFLQNNLEYDLCFHNVYKLYQSSNKLHYFNNVDLGSFAPDLSDILQPRVGVPTCSWMFRREKLVIPSWFYNCKMGDWPLLLFLVANGKSFYSSEIMGVYRKHEKGVSFQIGNGKIELINILKLAKSDRLFNRLRVNRFISKLYLDAAYNSKNHSDFISIMHFVYLIKSIYYWPKRIFESWNSVIYTVIPLGLSRLVRRNIVKNAI